MTATSPIFESNPSAFYSNKGQFEDRKKPLLTCEYCHWTEHDKENCYQLVGYPSGHRFYKGQGRGHQLKSTKDGIPRHFKPPGHANMSNCDSESAVPCSSTDISGHIFTPEQYAEIMKLLNKTSVLDTAPTTSVNMAGPLDWEDSWDW